MCEEVIAENIDKLFVYWFIYIQCKRETLNVCKILHASEFV